ncbi:MAG: antitoxin, partial [Thermoanaerobaculia bacterium]
PAILDLLHLQVGATVGVAVEEGRLVIAPQVRPSYSMEDLLAQCEPDGERTAEEVDWLEAKPVGSELL